MSSLAVPGVDGTAANSRRVSRGRFRRLSSHDARRSDLSDEPTIVVPPENVDKEGESSELASTMEIARRQIQGLKVKEVEENEDGCSIDFVPMQVTGKYAFAFDIDGVLIKGGDPIPEAIHAMKMLNGQNNRGIKV